jgi:uncharacterized membrane protein YjjP (DUF1212 family)
MKTRQVIEIALRAGEILLTSGAEIYRVEDTIYRICRSYNVQCEAYALPSGIFITGFGEENEPVSRIKRIKGRTTDLHKVELVNSFSRDLLNNLLEYEEALGTLDQINSMRCFGFLPRFAAAGINAFVFTMLFNGSIFDGLAALFISLLIFTLNEKVSQIGFFQFFEYFISGIVAGGVSLTAVWLFPELNIYRIIIGSIVILLPGVALTNSVKDALYGDINSSMFRLSEAVFIAVAVGAGVGISLSIGLRWVG